MLVTGNGSVDTKTRRSGPATMTFVDPEKLRPDSAMDCANRSRFGARVAAA